MNMKEVISFHSVLFPFQVPSYSMNLTQVLPHLLVELLYFTEIRYMYNNKYYEYQQKPWDGQFKFKILFSLNVTIETLLNMMRTLRNRLGTS